MNPGKVTEEQGAVVVPLKGFNHIASTEGYIVIVQIQIRRSIRVDRARK